MLARWGQFGLSLIEVLISLAILSMTLAMGAAGLSEWTRNAQIRTAAESISSGLHLARNEAIKRNMRVRFQFVALGSGSGSSCSLSTSGGSWAVSLFDVVGKCDRTPAELPSLPSSPDPDNPYIIQLRPAVESPGQVLVNTTASLLIFDGLGRRASVGGVLESVTINVSNPTAGSCTAAGGSIRCLRIVVSTMGQTRMCDPALAVSDPGGC